MLYVGSEDGAYRLPGALDAEGVTAAEQVLDSGAVMRLRRLDHVASVGGLFAATASGLHHSPDGDDWVDLGVPRDAVYAVGASSDGETLYAGTRPAAIYAADVPDDGTTSDADGTALDPSALDPSALDWRECEGFQDLPSREHWRLPRHEDLSHVRDAKGLPGEPDGAVAGVEVGGVHASDDRGETWTERRGPITDPRPEDAGGSDEIDWGARPGDVHDDVHELVVVDASEWLAATGYGLFRTTDAGASWTRLDDAVDQRYFRTASHHDGTTYVAGALSSSGQWDDPGEDPGFFAYDPIEGLRELDYPTPNEVVTGVTAVEAPGLDSATVLAATHRGSLLRETAAGDDGWEQVGSFPTGETTGNYTPLAWLAD